MKKLLLFLVAVIIAAPAFASTGIRVNGQPYGAATDLNFNWAQDSWRTS